MDFNEKIIKSPFGNFGSTDGGVCGNTCGEERKKLSAVLLCGSGVSTLFFIVTCVVDLLSAGIYDNVIQRVTGFIMYGLFLLLPAAVMAAAALYFRGRTLLPAVGAAVCAVLVALMLVLRVHWIMTLPALFTAAVCVILAVLAHKKKEV